MRRTAIIVPQLAIKVPLNTIAALAMANSATSINAYCSQTTNT